MRFLLFLAEKYIPVFVKRRELKTLFQLTASAFECNAPILKGLSYNDCLAEFALFTKISVDQVGNQNARISIVQDRLFQKAYEFGKLWRKRFRITTTKEAMRAARILYRTIGIDFMGSRQGTIKISKCFFSKYYSSATCRVISSIDSGIISGLAGGGTLLFSQRLTEGSGVCNAHFYEKRLES